MLHEVSFKSFNERDTVYGWIYVPACAPKGIVQLIHGFGEHSRRYFHMIVSFMEAGYIVAADDHVGHGKTALENNTWGDWGHQGFHTMMEDEHQLKALVCELYPNLPYFLYGHSMGSFYARWYAEKWPESITALVISGTAGPSLMNVVGQRLAGLIARVKGPRYVSPLMVKLNFGSYCRKIENAQSPNAWLSRDKSVVKAYDADGLCTFRFTAATYREMLATLNHVSTKAWAQAIDKDLPVLLIAGDCDPVGDYGSGVRKVWAMLGDAGVRDLTCQIFEGGRHELHNETNRDEVFDYVLTWIEDHIS